MAQQQASSTNNSRILRFDDGAIQFRQRLAVSILSCRPLLIRNIRSDDLHAPGLRAYEASFLRLLDRMTNGSRVEINNTGTQLKFHPGVLVGGEIDHECPVMQQQEQEHDDETLLSARSVGWFLEGILPLAPFGKEPLQLRLRGITDGTCHLDPSVDYLQATALPLMQRFGIGTVQSANINENDALLDAVSNISLKVQTRGAAPMGGGCVELICPRILELAPMDFTELTKVKRVRGTAISCKLVSSSMTARVAYAAKGVLQRLLPDVWIHTDVHSVKNHGCGPSPSLSLVLIAETTDKSVFATECCWDTSKTDRELPEDLGKRGAALLLEEIRRGGCIDTGMQSLALLWMCLTPEDVSRLRIGTLSQFTIESLRLFKAAFGVEFKVRADQDSKTVLMSCLGTGYRNMARAST